MDYYFPKVVQVVPFEDYTIDIYFDDGKIVRYDIKKFLDKGIFQKLKDITIFMETCTVLNDTLAWDINKNLSEYDCIDIDPEELYALPNVKERLA